MKLRYLLLIYFIIDLTILFIDNSIHMFIFSIMVNISINQSIKVFELRKLNKEIEEIKNESEKKTQSKI